MVPPSLTASSESTGMALDMLQAELVSWNHCRIQRITDLVGDGDNEVDSGDAIELLHQLRSDMQQLLTALESF